MATSYQSDEKFAHFVTLHQLEQWIGVSNVMIFCVPIVSNTINLQNYLKIIQPCH